jgi:hypothetical protein
MPVINPRRRYPVIQCLRVLECVIDNRTPTPPLEGTCLPTRQTTLNRLPVVLHIGSKADIRMLKRQGHSPAIGDDANIQQAANQTHVKNWNEQLQLHKIKRWFCSLAVWKRERMLGSRPSRSSKGAEGCLGIWDAERSLQLTKLFIY